MCAKFLFIALFAVAQLLKWPNEHSKDNDNRTGFNIFADFFRNQDFMILSLTIYFSFEN